MENTCIQNTRSSPALMVLASTGASSNNTNKSGIDTAITYTSPYSVYCPRDQESFSAPRLKYNPVAFLSPVISPTGMVSPSNECHPSVTQSSSYHSAFRTPRVCIPRLCTPSLPNDQFSACDYPQTSSGSAPGVTVKKEFLSPSPPAVEGVSSLSGTEIPDDTHNLRKRKQHFTNEHLSCCPVCKITLRSGEYESHLVLERERLDKITRNGKSLPSHARKSKNLDSTNLTEPTNARHETCIRIKNNRQLRLSAKSKSKNKKKSEETMCPVCNENVMGTTEELHNHVDACLKNRESGDDNDIDIEGEEYEEYDWAGQTRIRATTMLQGGLSGLGFQAATKDIDDEDLDLNVDECDNDTYGEAQYTEADIIPCSDDGEEDRKALRMAVINNDSSSSIAIGSLPLERRRWENSSMDDGNNCEEKINSKQEAINQTPTETITALKAKIVDQDKMIKRGTHHKCLICMEPYSSPLASIQCWHVHCEECWLRTLGAKKLCPQCNTITSPRDLRKIYL